MLYCSFCKETPKRVYTMDYVTKEGDPRGIPVGYPDPETRNHYVTEDFSPESARNKYIACDRCDEEVTLSERCEEENSALGG